jgi:xanthine dehydrogenase accessory factor
MLLEETTVVVKGAGDLGSGAILRLQRAGFRVVATEIEQPTTVRRTVAFSEAVYAGTVQVEGVCARKVAGPGQIAAAWQEGAIAILVDPEWHIINTLRPAVVVDAIMAKRNLGTKLQDARVVIGLGPGFVAGVDVHAVVETNRGHDLGRVLWQGAAQPDTGVPGEIGGHSTKRLLRAPCAGVFRARAAIGDPIKAGEVAATVDDEPVISEITGIVRGLLHDGLSVRPQMKVGDVDPRAERQHCFHISDKSLAIGGGVLEAVLYLLRQRR